MEKKIRCAIYDRVSHELQVEKGHSLEAQKELLTQYAKSQGYHIVGYYEDEGISARKKMENRKDLLRLLEDVKKDKIDIILVTKLDRWFRSVKDYHNTQAILDEHNCSWKTILEDYDSSTADGQLKINIMLSVSQNEADRTSERIKTVFEFKKRHKKAISGSVPFGYMIDDEKNVIKDPDKIEIVETAFGKYLSSFNKWGTLDYLRDIYGDDAPTENQLLAMFEHPAYVGTLFGIEGFCEPYINAEQREKILAVKSQRKRVMTGTVYLFSSMIVCPWCGKKWSGLANKYRRQDGELTIHPAYRCSKYYYTGKGRHPHPSLSERKIEDYLKENLFDLINARICELEQGDRDEPRKRKNRLKNIKLEMQRLNFLFQKGRIGVDYYEQNYFALEEEAKTLQEDSKVIQINRLKQIADLRESDWLEMYDTLDRPHKKSFWQGIIKEIRLDKEKNITGVIFL